MNNFIKTIIVCTFFLFFSSCIKTSTIPTQLQIQVVDEQGYAISGAKVSLYKSEQDFLNDKNLIGTTYTDENGYLYFSNLSPIVYYYYVQSGCKDNFNTTYYLSQPLTANKLNEFSFITLKVSGKISVANSSQFPYDVYVDNILKYSSQPANTTLDITEVSGGSHTVKVIQVSGYSTIPINETFTVNVSCGVSPTVTYPQ